MKVAKMMKTSGCVNLGEYNFQSSPKSCSSNSYSTDYTDHPSDEYLMQELPSGLSLPLYFDPKDDDMGMFGFFDKSTDELLPGTDPMSPFNTFGDDETFNGFNEFDLLPWESEDFPTKIKSEIVDTSSESNKSNSPVDCTKIFDLQDEFKSEPPSPCSGGGRPAPVSSLPYLPTSNIKFTQETSNANKPILKRVPIQPKTACTTPPKNKVVVIKNSNFKTKPTLLGTAALGPSPPKVVVLENVSAVSVPTISQIACSVSSSMATTCTVPSVVLRNNIPINVGNIDPRVLKRQQRKIKNRESACLSRKKKKDYLTALENEVKDLSAENKRLKIQNLHLKERLGLYEKSVQNGNSSFKHVKNSIILCMFVFTIGFNLDYLRGPFIGRSQVDVIEANVPDVLDHHSRNLLWANDDSLIKNASHFLSFSMCPAAINQTESARLVLELERWIGRPNGPLETSRTTGVNTTPPPKTRALRKKKLKKYETHLVSSMYSVSKKVLPADPNREIQVFSPTPEQLYSEFFEAINRQDDTFYVVSFSDHHMLLPALYHNKTRRPKMSLIMPSMLPNGNTTQTTLVPLMQIDCEVQDTRLIQIRHGSIPQHLRSPGNSTGYNNSKKSGDISNEDASYDEKKAYKPYFMRQNANSVYNIH